MNVSRFPHRDLLHILTLKVLNLVCPDSCLETFLAELCEAFDASQAVVWQVAPEGDVSCVSSFQALEASTYVSWSHCFKDSTWPDTAVHLTLGPGTSAYRLTLLPMTKLSAEQQDMLQQLGNSLNTVLKNASFAQLDLPEHPYFLFPDTLEPVLILDEKGYVLKSNAGAEGFWGGNIENERVYELLFKYARRRPWGNFNAFKQAAIKRRLQLPVKSRAGQKATSFLLSFSTLPSEEKTYYQLQLTRVENLSVLPESNLSTMMAERLEALVSFLPLGIFMENEEREHLLTNGVFTSMFGIKPDSVNPFNVLSRCFREPEVFKRLVNKAVEGSTRLTANVAELTDGRTVEWDYIPLSHKQNELGNLWVFRDVTEQVNSQREREIMSRVSQENPNPILRMDANGKVLYGNIPAQYLLHYWQREVGDYAPGFIAERVEESLRTQKNSIEKIVFGKRTFQVVIVPFASNRYVNLYATDVTERIYAEQSALEARDLALSASDAKSEFLATMSHEIRTPLNAILGMLDVLEQSDLEQEQLNYVKISHQAGDRLMGLITNLLDFSRIEAGHMTLENLPFNLRETVQETFNIFMLRGREKGVSLNADIPDYIPQWFKGDGRRLSQVFFILVDNALKFTDSGSITIHVDYGYKKDGRWTLECRVSDTGVGIPEEKQSTIFEVFSQADSSTTRQFGGSGLGLSIAKQLVNLFEGDISVNSIQGKGSMFSFNANFDVPTEAEIQEVRKTQYIYKPADFRQKWEQRQAKVLVVEDSPENRVLIQAYLKKQPVTVTFAHNGEEAIARYIEEAPDLILTDIQMPIMDGITATRKIRALDLTPVKIIVLSADTLTKTRAAAEAAGADGFLTKPISQANLLKTMDQFLGQQMEAKQIDAKPSLVSDEMPVFHLIEEVQDLLPVFFSVRKREPEQLTDALLLGDYDTIKEIGHRMRGSSATYGFPYFSELGERIETEAAAKHIDALTLLIQEFASYLDWTMKELAEYLD